MIRFNYSKVNGYNTLCEVDGEVSRLTVQIIELMHRVGVNEIKSNNWEEVFWRISLEEIQSGHISTTAQQVHDHIGLWTNATPLTLAAFKRVFFEEHTRMVNTSIKNCKQ